MAVGVLVVYLSLYGACTVEVYMVVISSLSLQLKSGGNGLKCDLCRGGRK